MFYFVCALVRLWAGGGGGGALGLGPCLQKPLHRGNAGADDLVEVASRDIIDVARIVGCVVAAGTQQAGADEARRSDQGPHVTSPFLGSASLAPRSGDAPRRKAPSASTTLSR